MKFQVTRPTGEQFEEESDLSFSAFCAQYSPSYDIHPIDCVEIMTPVEETNDASEVEAAVPVDGGSGEQPVAVEAEGNPAEGSEGVSGEDPIAEEPAPAVEE